MKRDKLITILLSLIAIFFTGTITSYATSYLYNANEVSYNNSSSGIASDNVQGAIDSLYNAAADRASINDRVTKLENISNFSATNGWTKHFEGTINKGSGVNLPSTYKELIFYVSITASEDTWYTFHITNLFRLHTFIEGYGYGSGTYAQMQVTSTQLITYDARNNGALYNPKVVIFYR